MQRAGRAAGCCGRACRGRCGKQRSVRQTDGYMVNSGLHGKQRPAWQTVATWCCRGRRANRELPPHSLLGFDKLTQRLRSALRLGSTSLRDLAQRLRRHGAPGCLQPIVPRKRYEPNRRRAVLATKFQATAVTRGMDGRVSQGIDW